MPAFIASGLTCVSSKQGATSLTAAALEGLAKDEELELIVEGDLETGQDT